MECCPAPSKTLFAKRNESGAAPRENVEILKCNYNTFKQALGELLRAWLDGREGEGQPSEEWETALIQAVNEQLNTPEDKDSLDNQQIRTAYDRMKDLKILSHLRIVTSHRYWIKKTYLFLLKIGVVFSDKMEELIRRHDLSKYTYREVLGYAVMFGDGQSAWKKLEDEHEKLEWEATLENHYAFNPHHPEYFGRRGEFGSTTAREDITSVEDASANDFVIESIIDMLASRGERILKEDPEVSVSKWMDIDSRYLQRYTENDRTSVQKYIQEWQQKASDFFDVEGNTMSVEGFFDKRPVVR